MLTVAPLNGLRDRGPSAEWQVMVGSLAPGLRVGPYLIAHVIGAGGMGEVYRARDTRLDRDVALKTLPTQIAQDPDRRARFEREARAVAALAHPNILAIYDVGSHEGTAYLVTELLEGETLRQRLRNGPEAPRKAVEMAVQIASGLAAAHEKGIVHRDLKPENVFVTHDGRVKILDFGLAAQFPTNAGDADSPTLPAGTEPGVVLGTVGYMSPEQVRGTRVDPRTDIFALGAVLFEMLTGRRAFQRETPAETMTAILREDVPELSSTGRQIPLPLDRIVRRCLEKNAGERLQAARDVAIALEAVSTSDASEVLRTPAPRASRRALWRPVAAAAALLLAGVALGFLAAALKAPATSTVELPRFRRLTFRRGDIRSARFAPDGRGVVYSAIWDGEPQRVYAVRPERPRADAPPIVDARLLAVSGNGDLAIAVSPRRETLFLEHGTLAQIPLSGGAPRELLEDVIDADFAADGRIAVVRSVHGRTRLEFPIGTLLYETAGWLSSPRISPDGTRLGFNEHPLHDDNRGWPAVLDIATKVKRNVLPEQGSLQGFAWAPNGQEVCFGAGGSISCTSIEKPEVRVVVTGAQTLALCDVATDGRMLAAAITSQGAQLAGEVGGRDIDLSWQDIALPIDFSPDGRRLLFLTVDYGVYLRRLDGGPPIRLADGIAAGISPDGQSVLAIEPGVPTTLAIVPVGPGAKRNLPRGPIEAHTWAAWMPDGRHVVMSATEPGRGTRLFLQDIGSGDPRAFTDEGVRLMMYQPQVVSADGRFVIAVGPDQQPALYPIAGGDPQRIPSLGTDLMPIGWGKESQMIFARSRWLGRLTPLVEIDVTTGRRQPMGEVGASDPKGAPLVRLGQLSRDGRRYAYEKILNLRTLFVIDRVKP